MKIDENQYNQVTRVDCWPTWPMFIIICFPRDVRVITTPHCGVWSPQSLPIKAPLSSSTTTATDCCHKRVLDGAHCSYGGICPTSFLSLSRSLSLFSFIFSRDLGRRSQYVYSFTCLGDNLLNSSILAGFL